MPGLSPPSSARVAAGFAVMAFAGALLAILPAARAQDSAVFAPAATPDGAARIVVQASPAGDLAFVENLLDGPIEVLLHGDGDAHGSDPPLPARARVPARSRVLVATLPPRPARPGALRLRLATVPGDSDARPRDIEYGWPLDTTSLRIEQGWNGAFSHGDEENRHAIDLAVPVGTTVLAAREGTVMQVVTGYSGAGLDAERDIGRANFVRILHEDGTMALYAHLASGGALVRQGERVARGQPIAVSGDTGFSGGPHLHFAVQANRGMRLQALPFRMWGPQGILRFTDAPP